MRGPVLRLEGRGFGVGGGAFAGGLALVLVSLLGAFAAVAALVATGVRPRPRRRGEWPRFLVALRSWSLADSTALVKGDLLRQWGRHDAAPRGREAPGMARTGLGFPPKSPPSGGSGPGVGLGRSRASIGVGNSPTPIPLAARGRAPPPSPTWGWPRCAARHARKGAAAPPTGGRAVEEGGLPGGLRCGPANRGQGPARVPCADRSRGRRIAVEGPGRQAGRRRGKPRRRAAAGEHDPPRRRL